MSQSEHIFIITPDNFESIVIQGSMSKPVLVDFWADWCAPCRMLMPILTSLAEEYDGQFILAKVNSDEQQEIAARYGVRSLPTVKLFKQGQPVDEFMGALPESEIRQFLDKHIERYSDKLRMMAAELAQEGDREQQIELLKKAQQDDPANLRVLADLLAAYQDSGQSDIAADIINGLPANIKADENIAQQIKRFDLMSQADALPDLETLIQKHSEQPDDLETLEMLALQYIRHAEYENALQSYLSLMIKDRQFKDDAGRKGILDVFAMLDEGDPLISRYRSKMASALY